jgi:hypothetical protein
MTAPLTAPTWKAGDRAMVEIKTVISGNYLARLKTSHPAFNEEVRLSSLLPLPPMMSAADAPVRNLATRLCALLVGRPPAIGPAVETAQQLQHELLAVRARTPSPKQETPVETPLPDDRARQIEAAREAVVEAAMALCNERRAAFEKLPPENPAGRALWDACNALRALMAPPTPADPVTELREAASSLLNCVDGQHDPEWLGRCKARLLAALRAQEAK